MKLGVELLSDVLLNATMPEKAIAREKEIQIAAIQQEEEQLTAVARNIMRQALFPRHPFALRANGSVESVQRLTQKDLLEFRDRYIAGKNGVIFVFGDVKAAEVKQLFEKALGGMKPGELALSDVHPAAPLSGTEAVESRKDKAQGVIMVGFRGASVSSPDRTVLDLIDEASSDLGSRFFVRIREQMGLAYYVGANQMQGLVPGLFAFYLGTDPQKITQVKAALLEEINKLAANGLTSEELARAKKKLIGQQHISNAILCKRAHREGYERHWVPFVKMGAPAQNHHRNSTKLPDEQLARVSAYSHRWKARQLFVSNLRIHLQLAKHVMKSAAQHNCQRWAQGGKFLQSVCGGSRLGWFHSVVDLLPRIACLIFNMSS